MFVFFCKETGRWQYYLHYNGLDRRNEVWKTRDEIQTNVDPSLVTKPDKNSGHGSHGHSENIQQKFDFLEKHVIF